MGFQSEDFWDTLLTNIETQRVIPIVGPELLTVQDNGVEKPLHQYVAERVAAERDINIDNLSENAPLTDLVGRWLSGKKHTREVIYKSIRAHATDANLVIPPALLKLAGIRHFKLFVTTTFDSLLERAVNQVRAPQKAQVLAYAPTGSQDIAAEPQFLKTPVVYHLLGRASATALPDDYVVTEEDMLEFVYSLLDKKYRPEILFDALKANSLLIVGSSLSDWLARFFIRGASGQRLSRNSVQVFLADRLAGSDPNLVIFLERFTNDSSWVFDNNAATFVDELSKRYAEAHQDDEAEEPLQVSAATQAGAGMPSLFLSYASEDLEAVRNIRDVLSEMGWDVWFDKDDLHAGDDWEIKIKRAISKCNCFVPVISQDTEKHDAGFFRLEWSEGVETAKLYADTIPFLVPIALNADIKVTKALVPPRFQKPQWKFLPNGEVTQAFRNDMQQILRDWHKRQQGR